MEDWIIEMRMAALGSPMAEACVDSVARMKTGDTYDQVIGLLVASVAALERRLAIVEGHELQTFPLACSNVLTASTICCPY